MEPAIVESKISDETGLNNSRGRFDPLLALIGTGKELWKDQSADEYVAELRNGWTGV